MIDPRILMPKEKPTGANLKAVAQAILQNRPLVKERSAPSPSGMTPAQEQIFRALSPANQMLVEDEMQRGAPMWQTLDGSPPLPQDPPTPALGAPLEPQSRFLDDQAYQVAQSGPMTADMMRDVAEQPALGGDAVQARRLVDDEVARRDSLNGLTAILEELQSNPALLDDAHTLTGRAGTGWLKLRDRLGIDAFDIGPEDEERLANTTAYKQELLTRVNEYIKNITGAQVGQGDETRRLMAVQANEGDSPTQVIAKITNALEMAQLDIARRAYMRREGGDSPTDSELRSYLSERGKALYEAAKASGLSPDQARMQAAEALSKEFGF